jgi:dCTP deaminase
LLKKVGVTLTVLSDNEIIAASSSGDLCISPFYKERLTPAGYDFASNSEVDLVPQDHKLISSLESIELGAQILAIIHLKSSLSREGLFGSFAIIDPGYRGKLTLSVYNAGNKVIHIEKNEPIVQVIFIRTGEPSRHPYVGKYQDSQGIAYSKRKVL